LPSLFIPLLAVGIQKRYPVQTKKAGLDVRLSLTILLSLAANVFQGMCQRPMASEPSQLLKARKFDGTKNGKFMSADAGNLDAPVKSQWPAHAFFSRVVLCLSRSSQRYRRF
jgi:hypothetical protein